MAKQHVSLLLLTVALQLATAAWTQNNSATASRRTLKVKLDYTGTAVVDKKHQIYILLCDANPYLASRLVDSRKTSQAPAPMQNVAHILILGSAATRNGLVTLERDMFSPVYAFAFLDKNGNYNGEVGDLPPQVPLGVYGSFPYEVKPIEITADGTAEITLTFDDSHTTP